MRQKIELVTLKDVSDFTEAVSQIDEEVTLIGKDENGKDWSISGKSFLASLVLANGVERAKTKAAHNVDWNTITCVCDKDIYSVISKWAVGSVMEQTMENKIHRTVMLHIQLQRDDFDDFLHIADELMSGIIELAQGKEVLSGKSLLGLMLIDTNKPQTLIIRGFFTDDYVDKFRKWEIKEG